MRAIDRFPSYITPTEWELIQLIWLARGHPYKYYPSLLNCENREVYSHTKDDEWPAGQDVGCTFHQKILFETKDHSIISWSLSDTNTLQMDKLLTVKKCLHGSSDGHLSSPLHHLCVMLFPFLTVRHDPRDKSQWRSDYENGLVRCIQLHVSDATSDTVCKILVDGGFHYVWY